MTTSANVSDRKHSKNAVEERAQGGAQGTPQVASATPEKAVAEMPRHRAIYEELLSEIRSGRYKPGERLPSETILCERFQASRITIAKAFQTLQQERLITRRAGSGTYVTKPVEGSSHRFGVLIPDFGSTDIFEPICQGIMRSPSAHSHSLTWGSSNAGTTTTLDSVEQLCQQYISERVSGVFFAPSEYSETRDESNRHVATMLERAGIPVVLLDRDFERDPERSNFDLVGIDNHRAGYILTRHLLHAGAKRIVFAARRNSATTVTARASGYRDALESLRPATAPVFFWTDFNDPNDVKQMIERNHPDGIVCANDVTAARIMQILIGCGIRIPADIRMAGIDDVSYAKFLPTPLTTLRQNCAEIGAVAMSTMLDRIRNPLQPIRDVLLRCDLIVRASCGSAASPDTPEHT